MKILWCTHSLAGFKPEVGGYYGCGWITSLLEQFANLDGIEIGIAFFYSDDAGPIIKDKITYYPITQGKVSVLGKMNTFFGDYSAWEREEISHLDRLQVIVEKFKPDVIHVWGTETDMGLIANRVDVPVIVHLQGLLNPIFNALLPPGVNQSDYIFKDGFSPIKILNNLNALNYWEYKTSREVRILKSCKKYFGRTHWDKAISRLYSPNGEYYYCSEILRDIFYHGEWARDTSKIRILSTISSPLYKGADLVLKTAHLLKEYAKIDFEWNLVGVSNVKLQEKITHIKASEVNVYCRGVKTPEELYQLARKSSVYFHPSYIDNSPNSVCEAQIIGLPVIAVNVGGVSTLIEDKKTGILTPPNEPHMAAMNILNLLDDNKLLVSLSVNSKEEACKRHNPRGIINSLLSLYSQFGK